MKKRYLEETFKSKLSSFYISQNFSGSIANTAARMTAVFFTTALFGLIHFTNALFFWSNPILFLPQVVHATIGGLILSLSKELSGKLYIPIGMHIGHNTFWWLTTHKALYN